VVSSAWRRCPKRTSNRGDQIPDLIGPVFPRVSSVKWLLTVENKSFGHYFLFKKVIVLIQRNFALELQCSFDS